MIAASNRAGLAFPADALCRAVVIKQGTEAEWYVIVRRFGTPPHGRSRLVPPPERLRTYAKAVEEAHLIFRRAGLPVLIEPMGEKVRRLTDGERRAFRNAYTPSRPKLDEILSRGPRHDR